MGIISNRLNDFDCAVVFLDERCVNTQLSSYIIDQFMIECRALI